MLNVAGAITGCCTCQEWLQVLNSIAYVLRPATSHAGSVLPPCANRVIALVCLAMQQPVIEQQVPAHGCTQLAKAPAHVVSGARAMQIDELQAAARRKGLHNFVSVLSPEVQPTQIQHLHTYDQSKLCTGIE